MGLCQIKYAVFISIACVFFSIHGDDSTRILYMMQLGNHQKAFTLYHEQQNTAGVHDFKLLQQMAIMLLDQGSRSSDPEIQLLTLFGAGISLNEDTLYILLDGLNSSSPALQLAALNLLSQQQNDSVEPAINRAMSSNYVLIRLEAAYHLAEKKSTKAVYQIEALMTKLDNELYVLFPDLYAMIGTPQAIKTLRRMLNNPNEDVRVKTVLSVAKYERDDLLPQIRRMASHHEASQQEACACALGMMKDESSYEKLQQLAQSTSPSVKLAALQAQYRLGRKQVRKDIEDMALKSNPFAIQVLGEIEGSEDLLYQLCKEKNMQIRFNAALALLERQDSRSLPFLLEIVIRDSRDLGFIKSYSQGKALSAWRAIPSATHNFKETPVAHELSLALREWILTKALELKENDFLMLANRVFELHQNELIPKLVDLLENLQTPAAIALLKKHQQKAGAPLIRNYCNLALYTLQENGPYFDNLQKWVSQQQNEELIRFRAFLPRDLRENLVENSPAYQLSPEDTSTLLIKSFEAFIRTRDDKGINILLDTMQDGNEKNKYALAGLLLRAIQ